jgi:hypothetical protein
MGSNVRSFSFVRNMCGIQVLEFRNYVFYMCSISRDLVGFGPSHLWALLSHAQRTQDQIPRCEFV